MKSAGVCHSDGYSHYAALLVSVSVLLFCGTVVLSLHIFHKTSSSAAQNGSRYGGWLRWCDADSGDAWMNNGRIYFCVRVCWCVRAQALNCNVNVRSCERGSVRVRGLLYVQWLKRASKICSLKTDWIIKYIFFYIICITSYYVIYDTSQYMIFKFMLSLFSIEMLGRHQFTWRLAYLY